MNIDVLEKRLRTEADRLGVTADDARLRMVDLGLDAAKERREKERLAQELAIDVLLVTATMTEHRELKKAAESFKLPFDKRAGRMANYYHFGRVGSARVASMQVQMGPFGPNGSAVRCIQARAETGATSLILVGTAFGVDKQAQRIGDVLVSDAVFLYDDRQVVDALQNGAPATKIPSYEVRYPRAARKLASKTWVSRFQRTAHDFLQTGETERVFVGTLLSGGARIESSHFRDDLIRSIPAMESAIIGGEMEALGAVSATRANEMDDPGWVVVKGISDFADTPSRQDNEFEEQREHAARSAAYFVLRTLKNAGSIA